MQGLIAGHFKGFRTYPTFIHLLFAVTCLCLYCFGLTIQPIRYYLSMSTSVVSVRLLAKYVSSLTFMLQLETDTTPWHTLFLALVGIIFGLCIGSFWVWHVYLVS